MAFLVLCVLVVASAPGRAQTAGPNELDGFMEKVLARREVNRQTLKDYVLDEEEEFEILGPGRARLHRTDREFTWYVRDGRHVRSPVRFNGVTVGEAERQQYEERWIRRERERQERKAQRENEKKEKGDKGKGKEDRGEVVISPDGVEIGANGVPTEPRFVSEAYFMDFKFEPGNYFLAGREKLEGKDVLRIEYYPQRMFGDDDDDDDPERRKRREERAKQRPREQEFEQDIDRKMNKTALITLWVDPAIHQIVKYTFENVWLDFLPAAWLVRVDEIRASMTMGQPFPDVWLPRDINVHAGITLALGSFEASYGRSFSDYRQAEVKSRITVPKREVPEAPEVPDVDGERREHGPFVADDTPPQEQQETIGEIRVHGNAFVTDAEVLQIAGVSVGQVLAAGGIDAIERRLEASGRFDTVEVRKRYRSLTMTDVALVLVVHEKPGVHSITLPDGTPKIIRTNPIRRLGNTVMFLPILNYADGYGFTYGARFSTVNLLGAGERLSVPLTWGGMRRAALEFERIFKSGPLTRVTSSAAIWQRENPRFDIDDRRLELKGRAERVFADLVRVGFDASRSSVTFGALDDSMWTMGANVELDTRGDPAFPGNAVLLGTGWTGLQITPGLAGTRLPRINRYTSDARGYVRVYRQAVIAARAMYTAADATLPPYERLLLGGSSTLRGFRTGTFDGDRLFVTSAELRVPLTSVISGARLGVNAFMDAGKAWDFDGRLEDAVWHRGVGAGVFLLASVVRLNLSVARGLKDGDTRVHLSSGFSF
jgi:hypothetical protein